MKGLAFDRKHPAIADVLAGLKRTRRRPVYQKAPMMPDVLRRLFETCGADLAGYRDRALLLLHSTARCAAPSWSGSMSST
jgi:hypothetical protein